MVQGTMLAAVIPSVLTSAGSLLVGGHTPVSLAAGIFAQQLDNEHLNNVSNIVV